MKRILLLLCIISMLAAGCGGLESPAVIQDPVIEVIDPQSELDAEDQENSGLLADETRTLASLEQIDSYPLYVMYYAGSYRQANFGDEIRVGQVSDRFGESSWACTLFTALGDEENRVYGRNFDWKYSPALLLFTDPPNGYASVSVVDLAYLAFSDYELAKLHELPLEELTPLLDTPWWPFDGMNDQGLAIGMAAVPSGNMQVDPDKETIDSLEIMREVLDTARNVNEAVEIFERYNINMEGGPNLHYLISDPSGKAALIEFYRGEMNIIWNDQPWHMATNFLCSAVEGDREGRCWRYDAVSSSLALQAGSLQPDEAISLLDDVAQSNTQWSVVYGISTGEIYLAIGQGYDKVYAFQLEK